MKNCSKLNPHLDVFNQMHDVFCNKRIEKSHDVISNCFLYDF